MRLCPCGRKEVVLDSWVAEMTDTEETQSSCSKLARWIGGRMERTYSSVRVDSEERPCWVRYSSREVRRKRPSMRKSKGVGWVVERR